MEDEIYVNVSIPLTFVSRSAGRHKYEKYGPPCPMLIHSHDSLITEFTIVEKNTLIFIPINEPQNSCHHGRTRRARERHCRTRIPRQGSFAKIKHHKTSINIDQGFFSPTIYLHKYSTPFLFSFFSFQWTEKSKRNLYTHRIAMVIYY